MSKGSRPRSGFNPTYRNNFDDIFSKPAPYVYPSGFVAGQRVQVIPGKRKYNNHIILDDAFATVQPDPGGCPADAVLVKTDSGGLGYIEYIDATRLKRV